MKNYWSITVLASILILGTTGLSYDAFAGHDDNNGENGCENANPNAKSCESNPNTDPVVPSIDPTSGSKGDAFTITDPEGRIQAGDVAIFTAVGIGFEYTAFNITYDVPDHLTGNLHPEVTAWTDYVVRVESSDGVERFSGISFTLIQDGGNTCPPFC